MEGGDGPLPHPPLHPTPPGETARYPTHRSTRHPRGRRPATPPTAPPDTPGGDGPLPHPPLHPTPPGETARYPTHRSTRHPRGRRPATPPTAPPDTPGPLLPGRAEAALPAHPELFVSDKGRACLEASLRCEASRGNQRRGARCALTSSYSQRI
ncbi:unnamed protein product [Arctogadus glacialis]